MNTHFFKETDDNWFPPFKLDNGTSLVQVYLGRSGPNPPVIGKWIIVACGNDDHNIVRLFDKESEAMEVFKEISLWKKVNKNDLEMIGFEY